MLRHVDRDGPGLLSHTCHSLGSENSHLELLPGLVAALLTPSPDAREGPEPGILPQVPTLLLLAPLKTATQGPFRVHKCDDWVLKLGCEMCLPPDMKK